METFTGMTLSVDRATAYLRHGVWANDTFVDMMERNAHQFAQLRHRDDTSDVSYSELWSQCESVAAHLYHLGIRKGDKVAIQLPTSLDFVRALFGISRIGAVAVILQADLGRQAIADSLKLSESCVLIATANYQGQRVAQTARSLAHQLPQLKAMLVSQPGNSDSDDLTPANGEDKLCVESFSNCWQSEKKLSATAANENRPGPLDPFVMVFTAGTSGSPKGIVHLHANTLWCARTYSKLYSMTMGGAMLCLAPVYHLTGFLVGITMPVVMGCRMLLLGRFATSRALSWIENERPNYIVGAPPHLIHIAESSNLTSRNIKSVKVFFYAGAPVPSDTLRQLQTDTGWIVGGLFGWSEGFLATATRLDDPIEAINQTVGHVIPGTEVVLMDDAGVPVAPGQIGEMWSRGPNFSAGYYNLPEAAREKWDGDGWFHSGDLLRQDGNGRFVYMGRRDNVINRGGTKIDPREVESVISQHPSVSLVAVVSVPDPTLGQKSAAAVVPKQGSPAFTLSELRMFLTEHGLAKYQLPDLLEFFEAPLESSTTEFSPNELRTIAKAALVK